MEDSVLGRGARAPSSRVPSELAAKWLRRPPGVRLNFHVEEEGGMESSEGASRWGRCVNKEVVRLDARLWVEVLDGRGKIDGRLGLGL